MNLKIILNQFFLHLLSNFFTLYFTVILKLY